jgi:hypothetical protein
MSESAEESGGSVSIREESEGTFLLPTCFIKALLRLR